jgi:hypothetical protein
VHRYPRRALGAGNRPALERNSTRDEIEAPMRAIRNILILIPIAVGFAVGVLMSPLILGFMIAYEWMAADIDDVYRRLEEKRKAREQRKS